MYGNETLDFAKATSKLLLEKRRLNSERYTSQEDSVMVASKWKKKKKFVQKRVVGNVDSLDTWKWIILTDQARQRALSQMLMSPPSPQKMAIYSFEERQNSSSCYVHFTMIEYVMLAVPQFALIIERVLIFYFCLFSEFFIFIKKSINEK